MRELAELINRSLETARELKAEIRADQELLAQSLRSLNEQLISTRRGLSQLDRRLSEVKGDLEAIIRMEIGEVSTSTDHARRDALLRELTEFLI